MSETFHHDVVFLGSSLSGLVAAGLLVQAGKRVMVVDSGEFPSVDEDGWIRPVPFPVGRGFRNVLKDLLFHPAELKSFIEVDPALQVVLPWGRPAFYSNRAMLEREVARDVPASAGVLLDMFDEARNVCGRFNDFLNRLPSVPIGGLAGFTRYRRLISEGDFGGILKMRSPSCGDVTDSFADAVLLRDSVFSAYSWSVPAMKQGLPSAVVLRPFFTATTNDSRFKGDWGWLRRCILDKIEKGGGTVVGGVSIDEIVCNGKRAVGVRLKGYSKENISASAVVINGYPLKAVSLFRDSSNVGVFEKWAMSLLPVRRLGYIQLMVFAAGLPEGMEGDLVITGGSSEDRILVQRHPFFPRMEYSDEDRVVITCSFILPEKGSEWEKAYDSILKRVLSVMPFLERTFVFGPKESIKYVFPEDGGIFSEDVVYGTAYLSRADARLHDGVSPVKDLYVTGRSVFPALGTDGEILAGRLLYRRLLDKKL